MPVSQKQKGIALIQKKYDQQVDTAAGNQSRVIGRFLKDYNPDALKEIYASSSEGRKGYIDPVELPDSDYAKQWLNYEYQKKAFLEDDPEHYTSNGERVRSKSELMIADTLKRIGIPYRYECPISLGGTIVYPDFTILRTSDRRELYWEHLGMMDNAAYCQTALKKIRLYESFKVFLGTTLILTMETSLTPINISVIAGVIQEYCI